MEDVDTHLGKRLRRRRKLLGLSQEELAKKVGVRFQQVQKYEHASNRMSAARLFFIAQALEVPVAYFYEGFPASEEDGIREAFSDLLNQPEIVTLVSAYQLLTEQQQRRLLDLMQVMIEPAQTTVASPARLAT